METSHGLKITYQIGQLEQKLRSACLQGPNGVNLKVKTFELN